MLQGAELLERLLRAPIKERGSLLSGIVDCERQGDNLTRKINERLNKTFVTPFEREDIYELAARLDDVLDFIEEAAAYLSLYQIRTIREEAKRQSKLITGACRELEAALNKLNGFEDISEHAEAVFKLEHEGDRLVRTAITDLFHSEKDAKPLLAWKDLFERLEDTLDAAKHTASTLKGITIRNS